MTTSDDYRTYSDFLKTLDTLKGVKGTLIIENKDVTDIDNSDGEDKDLDVSKKSTMEDLLKEKGNLKSILGEKRKKNQKKKGKKVTFQKPLKKIYEVESYKNYNVDVSEGWNFCGLGCFFKKKWGN